MPTFVPAQQWRSLELARSGSQDHRGHPVAGAPAELKAPWMSCSAGWMLRQTLIPGDWTEALSPVAQLHLRLVTEDALAWDCVSGKGATSSATEPKLAPA
jgi:hypothetical protein